MLDALGAKRRSAHSPTSVPSPIVPFAPAALIPHNAAIVAALKPRQASPALGKQGNNAQPEGFVD
ncbi:hypothetical protein GCM10009655_19330 [Rhodoglobus aureus]|uniref:Uncharacterized protein n=1 Tax=Rhodoglobus aureus TaxID=191497 RepID=A0ABP4GC04_9MICO